MRNQAVQGEANDVERFSGVAKHEKGLSGKERGTVVDEKGAIGSACTRIQIERGTPKRRRIAARASQRRPDSRIHRLGGIGEYHPRGAWQPQAKGKRRN